MPIKDLTPRPTEIGRIRTGEKGDRGAPRKLERFRLTSQSYAALVAAAELYGGEVKEWEGAPDPSTWELYTETAALPVVIPTSEETVSQWYELWSGPAEAERRCDGEVETITGGPCLCDPADRECTPKTRVGVMLPDLPGLGLWRLDSGGWHAAANIPSTISLLSRLTPEPWVPAMLRLVQRTARVKVNGKTQTRHFNVPIFDVRDRTLSELVHQANAAAEARAIPEFVNRADPAPAAPATSRDRVLAVAREAEVVRSALDQDGAAPHEYVANRAPIGSEQQRCLVCGEADTAAVHGGAGGATETADMPADGLEVIPPPDAAPEPSSSARAICGAIPPDDPNGLACSRAPDHKGAHKTEDAAWPNKK